MKFAKYSMLQMPVMAFFSKRFYRDIGMNRKGANLIYLVLLLSVCALPLSIHCRDRILQTLETEQAAILHQLPAIGIRNGIATVNAKTPCYINNAAGQPVAIIDTTGSMNYIDSRTVQLMLTETKLILRGGLKFDLSLMDGLTVDPHRMKGWIDVFCAAPSLFTYGICFSVLGICCTLFMFLTGIITRLLSGWIPDMLSFTAAMRIAVAASTPALIGLTVCTALSLPVPLYVYPAVTLAYLLFGLGACSGQNVRPENCIDLKAALKPDLLIPYDRAA